MRCRGDSCLNGVNELTSSRIDILENIPIVSAEFEREVPVAVGAVAVGIAADGDAETGVTV